MIEDPKAIHAPGLPRWREVFCRLLRAYRVPIVNPDTGEVRVRSDAYQNIDVEPTG